MTSIELEGKTHLQELFDRLRSGRHLCADDGYLYLALRADFEVYRALFEAIGFELVEHERGFYYFRSGEDLGKEATQLAVFFFVLIEAWSDAGKDLETAAFDPGGHPVGDLPHLTRESWRRCMAEADVKDQEDLSDLVRKLERYGFAERVADDRFRFRTPAWRFFDLCLEILDDSKIAGHTNEDLESP